MSIKFRNVFICLLTLVALLIVFSSCMEGPDKTPRLLAKGELTNFSGRLLSYRTMQSNSIELTFDEDTIYPLETIYFEVISCEGKQLDYVALHKEYELYQLGGTASYYLQKTGCR